MVCKNEQAIREKKHLLAGWLRDDPSTILKQAKKMNTATPLPEYLEDLNCLIKSKFGQRGCRPQNWTLERERVIVRYVVHVHLQIMDRGPRKKLHLVSHRNQQTPVEASTRKRIDGPPAGVAEEIQKSKLFFNQTERLRLNVSTRSGPTRAATAPLSPLVTPLTNLDNPLSDWREIRVATLSETRAIHLHHHPMEIYMAWRLHRTSHVYENLGPTSTPISPSEHSGGSTFVVSDSGPLERYPGTLIVACPRSSIYDQSFPPERFQLPINKLFEFLVRHGKADKTRSGGWRLEVSNAGLAQDKTSADFSPKDICGTDVFENDPDGPLVRAILGSFMDGLTIASKFFCREMGMPRAINLRRYEEYAQMLQEYFHGTKSDTESLTVQLLDLTAGHKGAEHFNVLNDSRAFDGTVAKVMFFIDGRGHLLSLKILCSNRKRLGNFYSVSMGTVEKWLVNIRSMLSAVNASYLRLIHHNRGWRQSDDVPTWDNVKPLFLDDGCPWETCKVTPTISQSTIKVLTGVGRGLWLSTAFSSIYFMSGALDEKGMIQMLMVMSWQNSFEHFWKVCQRMDCTSYIKYPIFEYYKIACELFHVEGKDKGQEMIGGRDPRFSPPYFDFKEVFGSYEEQKTDVVDKTVSRILALCRSLNVYSTKEDIGRDTIMKLVAAASKEIRVIAPCQLESFRLMLLLQGCSYLKVRMRTGTSTRQIFFPVKDSGSWDHVKDVGVSDEHVESVCYEARKVWMDEVEVILCESKEGRLLEKFDTFVKGQMLFIMDNHGSVWIKKYNENHWQWFTPRHCF
jgi:hypothetical protein